jgi:hypothetical protein
MASDGQGPRRRDDGVRVTRRRRVPVILPGLAVLGVAAWLLVRTDRAAPPVSAPAAPLAHQPRSDPATAPARPAPAARVAPPEADPVADADAAARHAAIEQRAQQRHDERAADRSARSETPYTLNAPGEHAGLEAMPPPGSKPIKQGIVVPDDVELPPGYIRHYQTTDDGRQLPPILMYHPDFAGTDANGNPIPVPADRIVPPDMAPPGLPHRTLDPTADAGAPVGRPSHGTAPYVRLQDVGRQ